MFLYQPADWKRIKEQIRQYESVKYAEWLVFWLSSGFFFIFILPAAVFGLSDLFSQYVCS